MTNYLDLFIKNTKARIEALGINQRELAKRLGIAHPNVSQLLSGKTKPGLDMIERYAEALSTTPIWLLTDHSSAPLLLPKQVEDVLRHVKTDEEWTKIAALLRALLGVPEETSLKGAVSDKR